MTWIEAALLLIYGLPIGALSAAFVIAARRMMREEERRMEIRRAAAKARRYEAARRKARGTPRKRPGSVVLR